MHESGHPDSGTAHRHGPSRNADRRYLVAALALLVGFMAAEVVVGLISGSLALLSDAAHMLTDAGAIALALIAMRLAGRPAKGSYTFGLKRTEILSAQINGVTLLLLVAYFTYEGIHRLIVPPEVDGGPVLATALVGIAVNVVATVLLSRADRRSLNVEGAFQHVLNDLFAFITTAIAGLVVLLTGWTRADAIAALVVAALMLKAGISLLKESGRVFLEAAPRDIEPAAVEAAVRGLDGVVGVHDLHVWEVTSGFPALSAHLLVSSERDCHEVRSTVGKLLDERFGIDHTTLQVEHREDVVPAERLRARLSGRTEERHPGHSTDPPGTSRLP